MKLKPPIRVFKKKDPDSGSVPVSRAPPEESSVPAQTGAEPVWKERRKMVREIPEAVAEESFRESTWAMFDIDQQNKT